MTASQDFITIYDSRDFSAHNLCKVHLRIISRNVKFGAKKAGSKNFGSNTYLEKLGSCVSINSTEDVIRQVDICFLLHSSNQLHSLLLTSTKIDSHSPISVWSPWGNWIKSLCKHTHTECHGTELRPSASQIRCCLGLLHSESRLIEPHMPLAHKLVPGQNTEILTSKQEFHRRNCRLEH